MNIKPFDNLEYAVKATAFLSDAEKIELAQKLCLMVEGEGLGDALSAASLTILAHADNVKAKHPTLAPEGGPLLPPKFEVVT